MAKLEPGSVVNHFTLIRREVEGWRGSWICRCGCGKEKSVSHDQLIKGRARSCGCSHGNMTHGHFRGAKTSPTRISWQAMIYRCTYPNHPDYARYGAVGISVCASWKDGEDGKTGFECFLRDMGERPSDDYYTIDRYPNREGNYEPGNCRWATRREQQNNMSSNRRLTIDGKRVTLAELVRMSGISRTALKYRLFKKNWPIERAVTVPMRKASRGIRTEV